MQHIIFYDSECPLCNRAIRFILATDRKKQFCFAPLNGKTAQEKIAHLYLKRPDLDTLVLLQNSKQILIEAKGAMRILWILGGKYAWIGWISFLPSFAFDVLYRVVARYRHRLFSKKSVIEEGDKERFLP
ncbi:MAG: hypothetical protein S4CHLAM123_04960 [Chlamydiales bacterium]|nr:hypothetical protein [Chlamydiales bacterium]